MVDMAEVQGPGPLVVLTTSTSVDMRVIPATLRRSIALLQVVYAKHAK